MSEISPLQLRPFPGKSENLHQIHDLSASCVSCGSKTDLTPCQDCELVFACKSHDSPDTFSSHASLCRRYKIVEKNMEAWGLRYQTVSGIDPKTDSTPLEDALKRDAELAHIPVSGDCQHPGFLELSASERDWMQHQQRIDGNLIFNGHTCPLLTCSHFYNWAASTLLKVLQSLASRTRSGPALKRSLQHGIWMLSQGLTGFAFREVNEFFLLALKFDETSLVETYFYNMTQAQSVVQNLSCVQKPEDFQWANGMAQQVLTTVGAKNLSYGSAVAVHVEKILFRYLNSTRSANDVRFSIEYLIPERAKDARTRLSDGMDTRTKQELSGRLQMDEEVPLVPRWMDGEMSVRAMFILVLRAMADLRAIQVVPSICGHILPSELILEVQKRVSTNPLVCRDQFLQEAICFGRSLEPYIELLQELVGVVFDQLEKPGDFHSYPDATKMYCDRFSAPWRPLSLPLIRPLGHEAPKDAKEALLNAVVAKIPGSGDVIQKQCLQTYPAAMSKLQEKGVPNPRELFLLAMSEREHYDFDKYFDNSTERPALEFRVTNLLFPKRSRRASDSSLPEDTACPFPQDFSQRDIVRGSDYDGIDYTFGDAIDGDEDDTFLRESKKQIRDESTYYWYVRKWRRSSFYVRPTPDVPLNSQLWAFGSGRGFRDRSMSVDSSEAQERSRLMTKGAQKYKDPRLPVAHHHLRDEAHYGINELGEDWTDPDWRARI